MDTVFIEGLRVDAIIGIHDWERQVRQTLVVDIELAIDVGRVEGRLSGSLDYSAIAERVDGFIRDGEYELLETLADGLADTLLDEFPSPWLRLRVAKPGAVAAATAVGVTVERGERPA